MTSGGPGALASFCRDCFLLARYTPTRQAGSRLGREWERAVSSMLWRPGWPRRQHAGTLDLFGLQPASGAEHELDGAAIGLQGGVWLEAKASSGVTKADVAVFDLKCRDLYIAAVGRDPARAVASRWWPVLVSREPATKAVRRLCLSQGVILCDPLVLPLPMILRIASNPEADLHLSESLLREAVRLFEPMSRTMQERLPIDDEGNALRLTIQPPRRSDLEDAIFAQDELSADILDYMDVEAPGALQEYAGILVDRLDAPAIVAA